MTDLSPAAQTVLDAVAAALERGYSGPAAYDIAANALRAAVDQVVPPDPCGDDCCIDLAVGIRADFLAIAAELEAMP